VLELHCRPAAGCGLGLHDNYPVILVNDNGIDGTYDEATMRVTIEFNGKAVFDAEDLLGTWNLVAKCPDQTETQIHVLADVIGPDRGISQ